MYAKSLQFENFKCFGKASLKFQYPGRPRSAAELKNVNLVLGDNGGGKSSILRAIAIAALAPVLQGSGFVPYRLVRRMPEGQVQQLHAILEIHKCAFCERQLEGGEAGKIEHDLEHFRPKSAVEAWPPQQLHTLIYQHATGSSYEPGYYWFAYDLHNYAAACKVCNSSYKHMYFPVAGARVQSPGPAAVAPTAAALQAEQPLLCYPLGSSDEDPEQLITFRATTAVPVHAAGFLRRRAEVMIDFFGLNTREQLHRERARMISLFGGPLQRRHAGVATRQDLALIAMAGASHLPHASCVRAYERLWHDDPEMARDIHEACTRYAVSTLDTRPPVV